MFDMNGTSWGVPKVLGTIIGLNCGVFAWWVMGDERTQSFMQSEFLATNEGVFGHSKWHTLLTSTFSHFAVFHLGLNMATLYFFGRDVFASVLRVSPRAQMAWYCGAGVASSMFQLLPHRDSPHVVAVLGASGAVSAVVVLNVLCFPGNTVLFYGLIPLPAWVFGLGFVLQDALAEFSDKRTSISHGMSVGHLAHLTGAAYGFSTWTALKLMRRIR